MCHLIKDHEEKIRRDMKRSINTEYHDLLTHSAKEKADCESRIVEGDVREEVLKGANSGQYALVVMGAYGKSGTSHAGMLFRADHRAGSSAPPDRQVAPSVATRIHSSVVPILTAAPHISGT